MSTQLPPVSISKWPLGAVSATIMDIATAQANYTLLQTASKAHHVMMNRSWPVFLYSLGATIGAFILWFAAIYAQDEKKTHFEKFMALATIIAAALTAIAAVVCLYQKG